MIFITCAGRVSSNVMLFCHNNVNFKLWLSPLKQLAYSFKHFNKQTSCSILGGSLNVLSRMIKWFLTLAIKHDWMIFTQLKANHFQSSR